MGEFVSMSTPNKPSADMPGKAKAENESTWLIQQPAFSFFELKQTERSANVYKAGILGHFYFHGVDSTSLEALPSPASRLNSLGQRVLELAKVLDPDDDARRKTEVQALLEDPAACGIPSVDAFEWMLFGLTAILIKSARTARDGQWS